MHNLVNFYTVGGKPVISVAIQMADGRDGTIGYIPEKGEYNFGTAEHRETITVTSGAMVINGVSYRAGATVVIDPGQSILIVTACPVTYLCVYN